MTKKKSSMTISDFAKKGGNATLEKHGKDHFKEIAKKRWAKEKSKK